MTSEKDVLMTLLSLDPADSTPVLEFFSGLPGSVACFEGGKNNFVYVPGSRTDRVVLVAHADTVWDAVYLENGYRDDAYVKTFAERYHKPVWDNGVIRQGGWKQWGLGADDRAGCAMLYLLRESGHSLLITDGEEHGQIGADHLTTNYPRISDELNSHRYMIQLDRRGSRDYKTYRLNVTNKFRRYIKKNTGYEDAGQTSRTDIITLCRRICGVNLSIGYYNEHTPDEYLVFDEWYHTYSTVCKMLEKNQPEFLLRGV